MRPLTRHAYLRGFWLIIALAALVRVLLTALLYLPLNSDQVMVGLMARHILAGEGTVFYWGQPYNGTLESYLTAPILRLTGDTDASLHAVPILFSLLFVGAVMALCRQLYGERLALICGLYLACGPAELIEYSVWPGYNYVQAMAFGTVSLILILPIARTRAWWRLAPAGFLLGGAIWAQPIALVYLPAVLITLAGPTWHTWQIRSLRARLVGAWLLGLGAMAVALLPAIDYNLRTHGETIRFLAGRPNVTHVSTIEAAHRLVVWSGPVVLGLAPPMEDPIAFQHYLSMHVVLYGVALLCLGLAVVYIVAHFPRILRWCASAHTAQPRVELALITLAVSIIGAYLGSSWSTSRWSGSDPRYLLPLYTLTPLVVRALLPPRATQRRLTLAGGAVAILALSGLAINVAAAPHIDNLRPLAQRLERQGVQVVYGDYWLVYRLAYDADERLIPVVVQSDLRLGLNRYSPYLRTAAQRHAVAWVVLSGSAMEEALRACLTRRHAGYHYTSDHTLHVYDEIQPDARCIAW